MCLDLVLERLQSFLFHIFFQLQFRLRWIPIKQSLSQVTYVSEDQKCWGAWDTTGIKAIYLTIDRLEKRGVESGSARRSFLKGRERAIVNQTDTENISQRQTQGKPLEMRAFPSAQIYTILTWTALNSVEMIGTFLSSATYLPCLLSSNNNNDNNNNNNVHLSRAHQRPEGHRDTHDTY